MSILTPKANEVGRVEITLDEAERLGIQIRTSQKVLDEIERLDKQRISYFNQMRDMLFD